MQCPKAALVQLPSSLLPVLLLCCMYICHHSCSQCSYSATLTPATFPAPSVPAVLHVTCHHSCSQCYCCATCTPATIPAPSAPAVLHVHLPPFLLPVLLLCYMYTCHHSCSHCSCYATCTPAIFLAPVVLHGISTRSLSPPQGRKCINILKILAFNLRQSFKIFYGFRLTPLVSTYGFRLNSVLTIRLNDWSAV